jgi:hypothetical protein
VAAFGTPVAIPALGTETIVAPLNNDNIRDQLLLNGKGSLIPGTKSITNTYYSNGFTLRPGCYQVTFGASIGIFNGTQNKGHSIQVLDVTTETTTQLTTYPGHYPTASTSLYMPVPNGSTVGTNAFTVRGQQLWANGADDTEMTYRIISTRLVVPADKLYMIAPYYNTQTASASANLNYAFIEILAAPPTQYEFGNIFSTTISIAEDLANTKRRMAELESKFNKEHESKAEKSDPPPPEPKGSGVVAETPIITSTLTNALSSAGYVVVKATSSGGAVAR